MKQKTKKPIHPKKYLGQNFLIDPNIINKIISASNLKSTDCVLEVGPGLGALTRKIAPEVKALIGVEKDRTLAEELSKKISDSHVKIYNDDILTFDFLKLNKKIKLIGNLPYYISSSIIEKLIENSQHISSAFITVQLEFAKRLIAKPGNKEYGSLTCFMQYHCEPRLLFKIKNSCFKPIPKVESAFVCLNFEKASPIKAENEDLLFKTIRQTFQQRRKTILNSLPNEYNKSQIKTILEKCNVSPTSRAENLTLNDFINISNYFNQL
ncbi:MAG: 16S rRNA (adenine(1518)-N(6)/adenine(1519)-N(6))-dimethyltransferase RsmA [Candidatus Omnitrophica bacterium]|nr:16S rRNA (adenine(1518)-N(6)/adenine(1519)-N(6))-dimethyltransferase RsmA [Candidatus Omnitrophota bacterium]